ncbi:MAG TPA: helix-turn-helix domain-containing protein, partial [Reyranella sp.]|nr:helix-turn-helix domain-containing protein [Reyranella sp.]
IREFATRLQRPVGGITAAAERLLQHAPWPGNVRELRNVIERACIMSDGRLLTERDFVGAMSTSAGASTVPAPDTGGAPGSIDADTNLLSAAQRDQIRRVLKETNGNKTAAARLLGVSRRSLYRWLDRLAIEV